MPMFAAIYSRRVGMSARREEEAKEDEEGSKEGIGIYPPFYPLAR